MIYFLAILYGAFDFLFFAYSGFYAFVLSIPIGIAVIWVIRSRLAMAWKALAIAALFFLFILFLPQIFLFGIADAPYALVDYFSEEGVWPSRAAVFVIATAIVIVAQAISSRWARWRGLESPEKPSAGAQDRGVSPP